MDDPSIVISILIVIIMVVNALVVACKRALDYVDRNIIKERIEDDPESIKLQAVSFFLSKPSRYHYANHAASFLNIVVCFILFNTMLIKLDRFSMPLIILYNVLFYAVYTALSDILPKKLAAQSSEKVSVGLVGFQKFIYYITLPFVWFCRGIANVILRIMGKDTNVDDAYFSEDKVMSMLDRGQESGEIKEEGRKMIDSIFEFDDLLAYEIMTPRTDVFAIDINDPMEEYIDKLMELKYSRIPVYDDDYDKIIGILNIKDYFLKSREEGFDNVNIRDIIRDAYFVPETKNIDSLFYELQKSRQHIAILIDEYGGFAGIVTIEDIVEEVMGEIEDEYDEEEIELEKIDENTYLIDGGMDIDDINEELGTSFQSDNSESIGGLIIDILGEIPDENEERVVEFDNYVFKIESVKDRRIEKVKLYIIPQKEEKERTPD